MDNININYGVTNFKSYIIEFIILIIVYNILGYYNFFIIVGKTYFSLLIIKFFIDTIIRLFNKQRIN